MSLPPVHETFSKDKIEVDSDHSPKGSDTFHLERHESTAHAEHWYAKFWQKDVDPSLVKEALEKYGDGTAGIDPTLEKKLIRKIDLLILPL
jgi:hypothetical protein